MARPGAACGLRAALGAGTLAILTAIVPARAEPVRLSLDPEKSEIGFVVSRPRETIEGTAAALTGEVVFDPEDPGAAASVHLRVEAASLRTGNRLRDRKMRRSHLEAERFPAIVFRSTSIRLSAPDAEAGGATLPSGAPGRALVEGTLSLHGVERRILFPVTIRYDGGVLEAEGEVDFRLSDHRIPIPRFLWLVLDDNVRVRFRFVAKPAALAEPAEGQRPGQG